MSRSCHRATFSTAASALVRISRASPQMRSASSRLLDLGTLEPPHLERDLLERGRRQRQHRAELGVTIALHDLRRGRLHLERELAADVGFELGLHVGEVTDRARELADRDRRAGPAEPVDVAPGLGVPHSDLETEAGGLGVDPVRSPDRQRVLVAQRENAEGLLQPLLAGDQEIDGISQLERSGRVPHVTRGEADVNKPRVLAELLLEAREERDHLVLDALLDGEDTTDVDPRLAADARHRVGRNPAAPGVGLADRQLHPEPGLVLGLLAPDATHLGAGVSVDHAPTIEQNR